MFRLYIKLLCTILFVMISGCVSIGNVEYKPKEIIAQLDAEVGRKVIKPPTGPIIVDYNYPWISVYEAIKYVQENSDIPAIRMLQQSKEGQATNATSPRIKYANKEKVILISLTVEGTEFIPLLSINFQPVSDNITKVTFLKSPSWNEMYYQNNMIDYLIDESQFVLKNDGIGYIKYTEENAVKCRQASK